MGLLKGALQLGSLEILATAVRFGRNILIARLLGAEEYGIASTYVLLISFIEAMTALGLNQFIIRSRNGDDPLVPAVVQLLGLLRAGIIAAAIILFAEPLASLLGQPDLAGYYRFVAGIMFLFGLVHVEVTRRQRALDFRLLRMTECGSLIASLVIVAPLALILEDHRLMLLFLGVEALGKVVLSLVLSGRPMRLAWDRSVALDAWRFGWPLILTAPMVFATINGDRLIVANRFTAADLGLIGAAITLAATPTLMIGRILGPLFFSALGQARNAGGPIDRVLGFVFEAHLFSGAVAAVAIGLFGPAAIVLVFGEDFRPAAGLVGLASVAAVLALLRGGFSIVSMAEGRTTEPMFASIPRLCAVPVAFAVAVSGGGVPAVLMIGIAGELAGIAIAIALFARSCPDGAVLGRIARLHLLTLGILAATFALRWSDWRVFADLPAPSLLWAVGLAALLALLLRASPELRTRIWRTLLRLRGGNGE